MDYVPAPVAVPAPAPAPAAVPAAGPVGPGLYTEIGKKARGSDAVLFIFPFDSVASAVACWIPAC